MRACNAANLSANGAWSHWTWAVLLLLEKQPFGGPVSVITKWHAFGGNLKEQRLLFGGCTQNASA